MSLRLDRAELEHVAPPLAAVLVLWAVVSIWIGFYRQAVEGSLARGIESSVVSSTLMLVVAFFSRQLGAELSRSLVILFIPISFVMLMAAQYGAPAAAALAGKRWFRPEPVAVLGSGVEARRLVDDLGKAAGGAIVVAGVILPKGASGEGERDGGTDGMASKTKRISNISGDGGTGSARIATAAMISEIEARHWKGTPSGSPRASLG